MLCNSSAYYWRRAYFTAAKENIFTRLSNYSLWNRKIVCMNVMCVIFAILTKQPGASRTKNHKLLQFEEKCQVHITEDSNAQYLMQTNIQHLQ